MSPARPAPTTTTRGSPRPIADGSRGNTLATVAAPPAAAAVRMKRRRVHRACSLVSGGGAPAAARLRRRASCNERIKLSKAAVRPICTPLFPPAPPPRRGSSKLTHLVEPNPDDPAREHVVVALDDACSRPGRELVWASRRDDHAIARARSGDVAGIGPWRPSAVAAGATVRQHRPWRFVVVAPDALLWRASSAATCVIDPTSCDSPYTGTDLSDFCGRLGRRFLQNCRRAERQLPGSAKNSSLGSRNRECPQMGTLGALAMAGTW